MTPAEYGAYFAVASALALVPGPTIAVIVATSLRHGTQAGMGIVAGTQAGFLVWLLIAALGLGAALAVAGEWFFFLRFIGAAYLAWLGIKMLRSDGTLAAAGAAAQPPGGSFFWQGFIVIITNPKMLVLFGTLIPPFIKSGASAFSTTLLLGFTFMGIAAAGDSVYAVLSGRARQWLSRPRVRILEIISGLFLLAGGVWLALH
jgi:threonine/homoserine/homoserine lactone efflux protein